MPILWCESLWLFIFNDTFVTETNLFHVHRRQFPKLNWAYSGNNQNQKLQTTFKAFFRIHNKFTFFFHSFFTFLVFLVVVTKRMNERTYSITFYSPSLFQSRISLGDKVKLFCVWLMLQQMDLQTNTTISFWLEELTGNAKI